MIEYLKIFSYIFNMNEIRIELAKHEEINIILKIYAKARIYMKENGNKTQWGEFYPSKEIILDDINDKALYVIKKDDIIRGVFAFKIGVDQTYLKIYEGNWINDGEYGVIHRIASDNTIKKILLLSINFALTKINHLRIDTHENNKIMNECLLKYSFSRRGIIYCDDGTSRNAYEFLK